MVVTSNNGVWIGWLDLLITPLQSLVISVNYNKTSAEPFLLDCRGLAPFWFSDFNLFSTTYIVSRRTHIKYPLPRNGYMRTHIESTSCNTCSIVAYVYCGRCIAMGLLCFWFRICCGLAYRVDPWQWIYTSHYEFLISHMRATCPAQLFLQELITLIIYWRKQIADLVIMQSSPCFITVSPLSPK
jgi:hypothetical protein